MTFLLKNVMTIGDNFNDSPMLALAGLGIAMGNAPEEVKETANLVTASMMSMESLKLLENMS